MEKKNSNEELQSRREFFKKAVKAALPVVGMLYFPNITSSAENNSSPLTFCDGGCYGECSDGCLGGVSRKLQRKLLQNM